MYVYKQLPNGDFEASAPLDGLTCQAATLAEAKEELRRHVAFAGFHRWHDNKVQRATKVAYDPRERCYVADCSELGVVGRGMTRQDALDKVYHALRQIAMSQLAANDEGPEENECPLPQNL